MYSRTRIVLRREHLVAPEQSQFKQTNEIREEKKYETIIKIYLTWTQKVTTTIVCFCFIMNVSCLIINVWHLSARKLWESIRIFNSSRLDAPLLFTCFQKNWLWLSTFGCIQSYFSSHMILSNTYCAVCYEYIVAI